MLRGIILHVLAVGGDFGGLYAFIEENPYMGLTKEIPFGPHFLNGGYRAGCGGLLHGDLDLAGQGLGGGAGGHFRAPLVRFILQLAGSLARYGHGRHLIHILRLDGYGGIGLLGQIAKADQGLPFHLSRPLAGCGGLLHGDLDLAGQGLGGGAGGHFRAPLVRFALQLAGSLARYGHGRHLIHILRLDGYGGIGLLSKIAKADQGLPFHLLRPLRGYGFFYRFAGFINHQFHIGLRFGSFVIIVGNHLMIGLFVLQGFAPVNYRAIVVFNRNGAEIVLGVNIGPFQFLQQGGIPGRGLVHSLLIVHLHHLACGILIENDTGGCCERHGAEHERQHQGQCQNAQRFLPVHLRSLPFFIKVPAR
ncbi:hypothetical protein MTY_1353 [Moorella thermoacetica Y72]|uniref:Uncharacterized protein n=1 Tax=Moorella thermoacetica Y72 TaxID=1325331 RepID=A0A0S6UF74_NEOTH|nr:hypothetical protein MTY_1353 [Moorella thermoacetica Y72]